MGWNFNLFPLEPDPVEFTGASTPISPGRPIDRSRSPSHGISIHLPLQTPPVQESEDSLSNRRLRPAEETDAPALHCAATATVARAKQ